MGTLHLLVNDFMHLFSLGNWSNTGTNETYIPVWKTNNQDMATLHISDLTS